MLSFTLGFLASLAGIAAAHGSHGDGHGGGNPTKPNIVLIFTDDQDKGTVQREVMPRLFKHLVDEGVMYDNFFAPVSLCCPSRVSLFRTQYAHNHNITYVGAPWGGYEVFNKYGYVGHTLPDFLQAAGYNTYYVGKLMNAHTEKNCQSLPMSGFNSSDFLVDPYTYDYWNPGFSRDNGPVTVHKGEYSTDLVVGKGLAYVDEALSHDDPFFVGIAPIASHAWRDYYVPESNVSFNVPPAAPRHEHMFDGVQAPRVASWNPDEPMGVSWVRTLPKLNATQEAYLDEFYRGRLRSLQPVDEMVEALIEKLDKAGKLDNTYIIYTSDNGYALGTHRRQPGKSLGFEEDIHVPLVVRGPGVAKGKFDQLSSYGIVDLSRTILDLAGAKTEYENDGVKINLHQDEGHGEHGADLAHKNARHSMSEYWVLGLDEGIYSGGTRRNNTYRVLRVHDEVDGKEVTWSYSVWCTGERELYDLVADPYQINNLLAPLNTAGRFMPFDTKGKDGKPIVPRDLQRILYRLDGLALVLKTCVGDSCTKPYSTLFPRLSGGEEIYRFAQVLHPRFDNYFANLPKVRFTDCTLGYQSRLEKPEWIDEWAFGGNPHPGSPTLSVQI